MTPYLDGDGFEPSKQFCSRFDSLSPFGTRESVHAFLLTSLVYLVFPENARIFFHFVIFATNSPGFTVSSAQAGRNPLLIAFRADFYIRPRRSSKRHFSAGKNFQRKRACKRARNSLSPDFRKHINTDLPHFFTVRRSARQAISRPS